VSDELHVLLHYDYSLDKSPKIDLKATFAIYGMNIARLKRQDDEKLD